MKKVQNRKKGKKGFALYCIVDQLQRGIHNKKIWKKCKTEKKGKKGFACNLKSRNIILKSKNII